MAILGLCLYTLDHFSDAAQPVVAGIDLQSALSDDRGEFSKVVPGRAFSFPADHGEHPGFKTEWWYFTGNLSTAENRRFGYQLTLFRVGLSKNDLQKNPSEWSTNSLLMGHFAVSDFSNSEFLSFERFARRSLGLAGVKDNGARIWLEDWSIERQEKGWRLKAEDSKSGKLINLQLSLVDTKSPVLQGEDGYSRKGPSPDHASYYVSQTRLASQGSLTIGEDLFKVSGTSWFDHEWSSEAMADGLAGWDWFSLQLSDNTELMLYILRYEDGRIEPASSGTFVGADESKRALAVDDFQVKAIDTYRSVRGVDYPNQWIIEIPSLELNLEVKPLMVDQEMTSGVPYWEGAVEVRGRKQNRPIEGVGFVELTGY